MSNWTLFSNHGHVLVCLARDSEARLRDVAADVGITERAVQKIVRDLQDGGMISVTKNGRRNCYRIHKEQALRHRLESDCNLHDLLSVVNQDDRRQLPVAAKVSESKPSMKRKPEPRKSKIGAGLVSATGSRAIEPEPIEPGSKKKPGPKQKSGSGEPEPSDSLEKQQGSLF